MFDSENMDYEHLLLKELNHAFEIYSKNKKNTSYSVLFSPLQKADKFLLENKISIFNLEQEKNLFDENLNGLGKLLTSSIKARNIIWKDNLGLVGKVAGKYNSELCHIIFDELTSEGNFGLLKAIPKFKPDLNVSFIHYALKLINQHMAKCVHQYLEIIKLPINFHFNYENIQYFTNFFKERFHRSPNDEELAEFMNKSVKYIENMKIYEKNLSNVESLNCLTSRDDEEIEIIDTVVDSYSSSFEDRIIEKIMVEEKLPKLSLRERSIILKRFEGKTLENIAIEENLTKQRISKIELRAVSKIDKEEKENEERYNQVILSAVKQTSL